MHRLLKNLNIDMDKFYNGLDTKINEGSKNISGGEKLKIAFVRTFLKDPDVIVLDEPTSVLDFASIEKLKSIITEVKKEKIVYSTNRCTTNDRIDRAGIELCQEP